MVYNVKMGGFATGTQPITPPPRTELSCASGEQRPHVDCAVWAPRTYRFREQRTFCGYHFGPESILHRVELKGQARFPQCEASRDVSVVVAAIMRSCAEVRQNLWFVLLDVALSGRNQNAQRRI